ncbi:hypothetical protein M409DRAFT_61542 [Zasmidium cellare ATCC 36951]|uniref:Uncharacterized protein n=1 Tax=Zasmidium cellare ATCC 36951 TaxID=1080233 RepID=A0A6A6BYS0_ZASCE|nr:uncharacterized protein M409DRAFT_61542 [Zasmidium cellare ATCC 36951]KAF2158566.1 hypothetical protein M409DRAFT_61542 [Zasmidium cellare ATCC 36951]
MQTFAYPQASGPSDLTRTDTTRSTETHTSSHEPSTHDGERSRRPSTKPASLQLSLMNKQKMKENDTKPSASSILSSINRKLDRFLDDIRENGFIVRGSKYLSEAEEAKSLPPTPCRGRALELTFLIPKPLSSTSAPTRGESQRRKLSKPADAWKRIGSPEYRFL